MVVSVNRSHDDPLYFSGPLVLGKRYGSSMKLAALNTQYSIYAPFTRHTCLHSEM